ncbi:cardiomyopathy-associated protein 5-like isoform X2 [Mugil cephalus]|uniref:cardiomyopathy-associated protein 5-like isoform X2 n=1 Tax=Mugil cephalus TaxID=48193 RepID=UPI001FB6F5DB|nr:cardiomyopathy-associated protein 5-like isoform X2 [Mugil cephalus]
MSSSGSLRDLMIERQTVSPEEIFKLFERTVVQYEEDIDHQRRLLDITWKPEIKLYRIDLPHKHVCTEEVLTEQQLCNQERNSSLDQEEPEPPQIKEEQEDPEPLNFKEEQAEQEHPQMKEEQEEPEPLQMKEEQWAPASPQIKEEQEELFSIQWEKHLVLKQEIDSSMETPTDEEMLPHSEGTVVRSEVEINHQRRLLDITWKPEINLHRIDLPHQHVCTEEEVLTEQQLCDQEKNSSLDQEEPEPPQIEEEQEDPEHPQIKEEEEEPGPPQIKEEVEEPEPPQITEEEEDRNLHRLKRNRKN